MIDAYDRKILKILQQKARTPNVRIAREIGMAPSAVLERIRKLEARGVIQGYEARINPQAVGLGLLAFVFVRSEEPTGYDPYGERLAEIPEVQEVHHVAGEDCYLVKVRAEDAHALGRLLRERFGALGRLRTRTTVVLETLRENAQLLLEPPAEAETGQAEEARHA